MISLSLLVELGMAPGHQHDDSLLVLSYSGLIKRIADTKNEIAIRLQELARDPDYRWLCELYMKVFADTFLLISE